MSVPASPKIYHIVHMDKLASIVSDGALYSDSYLLSHPKPGTIIGMSKIKKQRLKNLLPFWSDLHVGDCVPFYFGPRSVMLYMIYIRSRNLAYQGGQEPIVHLEADLHRSIRWANSTKRRWSFTTSNAGANNFASHADITQLTEINWSAVRARDWSLPNIKHQKQAEFLVEMAFPWSLITRIGCHSTSISDFVELTLASARHRPLIDALPEWYYGTTHRDAP